MRDTIAKMNLGGTVRLNKMGVAIVCGVIVLLILYMTPKNDPIDNSIKINLRRLLLVSIEAAERGGKEVVKVINQANLKEQTKGKTNEGVSVPVTNGDYKSHCVMYYGISKSFPAIKVISEEEDGIKDCQQFPPLEIELLEKLNLVTDDLPDFEVPANQIAVWIDPLDATQEYTEQLYNFVTTMVCVAYQGNPIIGIIHKPFGNEPKTTWAWLERGKSPHLKIRKPQEGAKKTVIISRSHPGVNIEQKVRSMFPDDIEIIHAGGSGYKSLEVAAGNVTAYVHTNNISKWDICAGDAIIKSLDGSFVDLDGKNIDYSASSDFTHKTGLFGTLNEMIGPNGVAPRSNDNRLKYSK